MAKKVLSKRKEAGRRRMLPVVVERDEDGYFIYCPTLEGCYTQGDTYEEAMENIKEVIALCLEDEPHLDDLPTTTSISFCTMEVQA